MVSKKIHGLRVMPKSVTVIVDAGMFWIYIRVSVN